MSQAQAAAAVDRLPWLQDEPKPQLRTPSRRRDNNVRDVILWAFAAVLLVAVVSYWMGARSWEPRHAAQTEQPPATTVPLPQPGPVEQQPQVVLEPAPQVSPAPVREVPIQRPRAVKRSFVRPVRGPLKREPAASDALEKIIAEQKAGSDQAKRAAPPSAKPAANPDSRPLKAWPASQSQGARGRIVRIGAFGTREQAKLGWRYMVRAYPGVARLKATVVADRNSRGRHFYRFQIGTTSQAHSEVLCQRMDRIHLSCAVVGLAWKPKGVER